MSPAEEQISDWKAARECLHEGGLLSVVMPAYHLADTIVANVRRVHAALLGKLSFEVIPVDDGSHDGTAAALSGLAAELPEVRPLILPDNVGKGAALSAGTARARGTHILLLDGDLDLPPEPLANFFTVMQREKADIVIGSKMHPESQIDYPLRRRIASRIYYGIVKLLVGLPVRDTQTGMKLFKAEALRYAFDRMLAKRFAFDLEVLAIAQRAGFRIAEAPVQLEFGRKMGSLTARNVREIMTDTLAIFYRLRLLRYYDSLIPLSLPNPLPTVSVVIACPGHSHYLDTCLKALAEQNYPGLEIIVLPDEPLGDRLPANVREIPTGRVRPAEKRNLGIAAAAGVLVAFVDDDAAPAPGWLQRAVSYFGDQSIGGVGGPATTPPDDPYLARIGGRVYANPLVSGAYRRRYVPRRVCLEDDIPSCNLIVRTALLRQLGGFDTQHWPGEDTLLCMRIVHELGHKLYYDPWIQVTHHRRPLFAPHLRQIGRYALHRGVFARHFPQTSRRPAYMLPSLLLLGIVFGPLVGLLHSWLMTAYFVTLAFYLACVIISAFHLTRPDIWLITSLGVIATHLTYGARFLQGLAGAPTPTQAAAFDHPSEESTGTEKVKKRG